MYKLNENQIKRFTKQFEVKVFSVIFEEVWKHKVKVIINGSIALYLNKDLVESYIKEIDASRNLKID